MTQTVTLLLLLAGEPSKGERALLANYARQKRVALVAPTPTPAAPYPAYSREFVLDIEGRLDEARTLASSLDEERALGLLAAIERDLVDHPELPQAAWLLAEHHRIAADVRRGDPSGSAEAAELSRQARVLEGPRVSAFGATDDGTLPPEPSVRLTVADLDARDALEIDGASGGAERRIERGIHQIRVLRDGELVFAGWSKLGDGATVTLGVRPLVPCSSEDLAGVEATAGSLAAVHPVSCAHWFVARRRPGGLDIASCQAGACSGFTPLVPAEPKDKGFPAWATVALVGGGVLATGFVAAWAAGRFDPAPRAPTPKTEFVYGGLR